MNHNYHETTVSHLLGVGVPQSVIDTLPHTIDNLKVMVNERSIYDNSTPTKHYPNLCLTCGDPFSQDMARIRVGDPNFYPQGWTP